MNRYEELRQRQREAVNALPLGFAFSQKQFAEMMRGWGLDPKKDVDKICFIGDGGYVQKKDAGLLHETQKRHDNELEEAIAADTTGEGFIYEMFLCELSDHEYAYTGDITDTLDVLGYTREQVLNDPRLNRGLEKAIKRICKREG